MLSYSIVFAFGFGTACGLWWFVDRAGGVSAVEKSVIGKMTADVKAVETKVKDEVTKVL